MARRSRITTPRAGAGGRPAQDATAAGQHRCLPGAPPSPGTSWHVSAPSALQRAAKQPTRSSRASSSSPAATALARMASPSRSAHSTIMNQMLVSSSASREGTRSWHPPHPHPAARTRESGQAPPALRPWRGPQAPKAQGAGGADPHPQRIVGKQECLRRCRPLSARMPGPPRPDPPPPRTAAPARVSPGRPSAIPPAGRTDNRPYPASSPAPVPQPQTPRPGLVPPKVGWRRGWQACGRPPVYHAGAWGDARVARCAAGCRWGAFGG